MIPIHFQAVFLPDVRKFKVEVVTPANRWIELMTIARFLRFARGSNLVIGGVTVVFTDDDGTVKKYFKTVADCYVQAMYKRRK